MDSTFEIDTLNGIVSSTSSALAHAMADVVAELIAAEYRADEEDLLEVVSYDLDQVESGAGVGRAVSAA